MAKERSWRTLEEVKKREYGSGGWRRLMDSPKQRMYFSAHATKEAD